MDYLYLDIETIPSQNDAVKARIAETITAPGNIKKPESIAVWEKDKKPAAVDEAISKTSFDGGRGHVCCIGLYPSHGNSGVSFDIKDDINKETDLLELFAQTLRGFKVPPIIVGHNVNNFDIRFLWQRAICLGVKFPSWFPKNPKIWGHDTFDTMTAWAGQHGTISLDNLAFNLGIKGKGEVDGSMVAQMWRDGKHQEIADYCLDDVHLTKQIHEKMMKAGM
ncbi:MAG: hypothetical protein COB78_09915 [Hyphomicrobiales bacterium]|nr:MAG: hypothetical protein COB78_09915 [Hyphomicrobiales bacterium]